MMTMLIPDDEQSTNVFTFSCFQVIALLLLGILLPLLFLPLLFP